jgi:hypothetical protein
MRYTELLKRIRAEYMEMPGLRVTIAQGQRLFGLEWTLCQTVFDALVDEAVSTRERARDVRAGDRWGLDPALSAEATLRLDPRAALAS